MQNHHRENFIKKKKKRLNWLYNSTDTGNRY